MDSFKIIKPKYSKTQRNWFGAIDAILGIVLGSLLLWILVPLNTDSTINSKVSMVLIVIIAIILPLVMIIIVDKRIINAYSVVGNLDFLSKVLMIRMDNNQQVEYKDVKMMCIYPLLIYGRGGIIAITLQIFTHDNETIDLQIHYKSDTVKRRYFLFNARANIFDIIKTRKIKYKWIRKKK